MRLSGVELAPLAGPHDLDGVGDCSWPVKALPECIAHEGARRRVVAADSGVDVPDQLLALGNGDAALHDSRRAMLVQFVVDHDERHGPPGDASRLGAVRG